MTDFWTSRRVTVTGGAGFLYEAHKAAAAR